MSRYVIVPNDQENILNLSDNNFNLQYIYGDSFDWLPRVNELNARIMHFATLFNLDIRRKVKEPESVTFIGTNLILVPVVLFEA